MKRLIFVIVLMISGTIIYGQKSFDNLFDKYAGKDGFVTVSISGDLMKMLSCDEDNDVGMPKNITSLRILVEDDNSKEKSGNFYDFVIKDIDLSQYEEFMRVKEARQDLRMLVKMDGDKFSEFLLIAGGDDNALIQIKGNMSLKEARKFSEGAKKEHGTNILGNKD
ncbi:MAG TPA: DUF4252 domain-containing protein [Bacteroidales bacterium]|nr:DUF4252 domain-containing protein [Bacteroidales bacterium]